MGIPTWDLTWIYTIQDIKSLKRHLNLWYWIFQFQLSFRNSNFGIEYICYCLDSDHRRRWTRGPGTLRVVGEQRGGWLGVMAAKVVVIWPPKSMEFHWSDTLFEKIMSHFMIFKVLRNSCEFQNVDGAEKAETQAFNIGFGMPAWRGNPGHGFVSFFLKLVAVVVAGSRYPADLIGPRRCPGAWCAPSAERTVATHGSNDFPCSGVRFPGNR